MSMRDRLVWEEQQENATRERCRSALEALAELPIEDFGWDAKGDDHPLYAMNGHVIKVGHVKDARAALSAMDGTYSVTSQHLSPTGE